MSLSLEHLKDAFEDGFRVRESGSLFHLCKPKVPKLMNKEGYLHFTWQSKRTRKIMPVMIHRLAAYQWFGESAFEPGMQVRHLNGNSLDNRRENLKYGTQSENRMDMAPSERVRIAKLAASKFRKLTSEQLSEMRSARAAGAKYKDLMKRYGITSKSTVSYIINNKTYIDG